jgi:hypothetical protein
MLRCEGTKIWRDQILLKSFENIDIEICIMRTADAKIWSSDRRQEYI